MQVHVIDDKENPINGTIQALGHVMSGDTLIIKFPFEEVDIQTLESIYQTLSSFYPENKVIMISNEFDILEPKSREEYKEFLKSELALLEGKYGNGQE